MPPHRNHLSTLSPLDLLPRAAGIEIADLALSIPSALLNDLKNPDSLAFKTLMNEWMNTFQTEQMWDAAICMQCIQQWLEKLLITKNEESKQQKAQARTEEEKITQ